MFSKFLITARVKKREKMFHLMSLATAMGRQFFLFIQKCGILNTDSVAWCHRGYQQNEVNANCVHNVVQG